MDSALPAAALQCLISAALLVATAFRLRDQEGLTAALRLLVEAVEPFSEEEPQL